MDLSRRVASRYVLSKAFFEVGDYVWGGKYKNKLYRVLGFGTSDKGDPTISLMPVPKGRKQDKVISLFKVRKIEPEELAELKAKGKLLP